MEWECLCDSGWYGAGCNIYLEQDCSDRKDNDGGKFSMARKHYKPIGCAINLSERHMYTIYLKPNDDVGSLGEYINWMAYKLFPIDVLHSCWVINQIHICINKN